MFVCLFIYLLLSIPQIGKDCYSDWTKVKNEPSIWNFKHPLTNFWLHTSNYSPWQTSQSHWCFNTASDLSLCESPGELGNGRVPGKQFSPEDGQLDKHELHQYIHQSQTKVSLVRLFLSCLSKLSELQCQWTYEETGQVECKKILWVLSKSFSNCTNFNPVSAWLHTLLGFPRASRSAAWAQERTQKQTHTQNVLFKGEALGLSIRITIHMFLCPTIILPVYTWPLQYLIPLEIRGTVTSI